MVPEFPELTGAAGAAFQLRKPAPLSVNFEHMQGRVVLREGSALVVVIPASVPDNFSVREVAWQATQESLDVLAAKKRAVLATSRGDTEYLVWSQESEGYSLTCVSTIEYRWSMQAKGTVGTLIESPPTPPIVHHLALRFYRMAQCATDLFDAYRNAYLALECLISDVAAKLPNESELNWLQRVVSGPLADGVPGGCDPMQTLTDIYKAGRNPLFHAKLGETFYPPDTEERERVQELFERLTVLLVCLLQYKLGNHVVRRSGSISRVAQDSQARILFAVDEIRFQADRGSVSATPTVEIVDYPRRFRQLWAKLVVSKPRALTRLQRVDFLRDGAPHLHTVMMEAVPIERVSHLEFQLNVINQNVHAPRGAHPG